MVRNPPSEAGAQVRSLVRELRSHIAWGQPSPCATTAEPGSLQSPRATSRAKPARRHERSLVTQPRPGVPNQDLMQPAKQTNVETARAASRDARSRGKHRSAQDHVSLFFLNESAFLSVMSPFTNNNNKNPNEK